jgi:hypothetical protein
MAPFGLLKIAHFDLEAWINLAHSLRLFRRD